MGTEQYYFGASLGEFLRRGGKVSKTSIDSFVDNYKKVIKETHFAHGDFVIGYQEYKGQMIYIADLDNIRVGPNGELKFIDYHGRNGIIAYHGNHYPSTINDEPSAPSYIQIRDKDPERTKATLYRLFGYNH